MANTNVGTVAMDLVLDSGAYSKQLNKVSKSTENAFSGTMKKVGGFIAGAFAIGQVVNFTKTCIDSASKIQSAFTGLNSIVQGTGNSFGAAQKFINEYTADGLISINEAATAYKNLLSRGYDTSQIEDVLLRLKDSAAFGRQASYDLGEAVVAATEGLKNENSILVDNAGVTKNVAKMWEEYADSLGISSTSLTQAQKIQAEYNGIMQETRFQVGDAAAYTKTFSGQIQQLKASFNQMTAAIGKVVAPLAQLFIPIINSAIERITSFFEILQELLKVFGLEMPDVVSKTSSSFDNVSSSIENTGNAAVATAKKMSKSFANIDEVNVLQNKSSSASGGGTSSGSSSGSLKPGSSSGIVSEEDNSVVSELTQKLTELKNAIADAWNSKPIQSFVGAIKDGGNYIWTFWSTLCQNLKDRMGETWNNIKDNAGTALTNMSTLWTTFWTDVSVGIQTWGQPIIDNVSNLFNTIWTTAIDPALQNVSQAWSDFTGTLLTLWNEHGQPLIDNIGEFITNLTDLFQKLWDNILEPIIKPFLEMLKNLWDEHLKDMVKKVGDFIAKLVNGALQIWNEFIYPIISWITEKLAPVFSFLGEWISNIFGNVFGSVSDFVGGIIDTFSGIIDFITGIFTGDWEKAWNGVKDIFKGIVDGLAAIFKAPINFIIDAINSFIRSINKIKIPDWVPGIGGMGIDIPEIPKLAQGAYFPKNQPQLAIVGDNTREPEIVTPESKIYDQVRNAIRDSGGTGKQEIEITIYHKYEDGRTIIQKINQAQIDAGQVLVLS